MPSSGAITRRQANGRDGQTVQSGQRISGRRGHNNFIFILSQVVAQQPRMLFRDVFLFYPVIFVQLRTGIRFNCF